MAPPLRVRLDQAAHDELERRYHTTRDATTRTRYQMILLRAEDHPVVEVAQLTRCSPDTVRRVLKRYLAGGPDAVPHRPHLVSRPTTRPSGRPGWSGSPTWIPTRSGWTVRCGAVGQGAGAAGVGKKRVRVEALLAAAAAAVPPPAADLVPDATLADDLFPEDLPRLLGLLGRADLYLQDEVEVALHPTLTRVWSRAGRAGQRLVQAPGKNFKQYGFGLVDWRDGQLDWAVAEGRRAVPLVAQLRRAAERSRQRGRIAMVILDNLGIHTPKGSRLLRALLAELGEQLVLVYTPTYDPDANRIEWLWRALRRGVTHTHQRQLLQDLLADADRWARTITPAQVLAQIGSPFALDHRPVLAEELNHAA